MGRTMHPAWVRRIAAIIAVFVAHGIAFLLILRPSLVSVSSTSEFLQIQYLPPRPLDALSSSDPLSIKDIRRLRGELSKVPPPVFAPGERQPANAINPTPAIDWLGELETESKKILEGPKYRDLSGLTQNQIDWLKRNRFYPIPGAHVPGSSVFKEEQHLPPGVMRLNDNCVLVAILPYCRFPLGKQPPNGHLFDDMRRYLDERDTYSPEGVP